MSRAGGSKPAWLGPATLPRAREILGQCESCQFTFSARLNAGRVTSTTTSTATGRHEGCGGKLRYYDTAPT